MRIILALSLLLLPVAAEDTTLAHKFPSGAVAYAEVSGLAGKIEALLDSNLGASIRNHPAMKFLQNAPPVTELRTHLENIENATGFTPKELLKTVFGDRFAIASYGAKQSFLAVVSMSAQHSERIVSGVEKLFPFLQRAEVVPAGENTPALMRLGPIFFFHDGKHLILSPDRILAVAARQGPGDGLAGDRRFVQARTAAGAGTLFGFVDLNVFAKQLKQYKKPKQLGEAILFGAFAHYLPKAPWAAFRIDLNGDENGWTLAGESYVPLPAEGEEPVDTSYRGTLKPLPFALPERTVGLIRMRRNLASIWSHREALIAPKGIPGLIQFETNFGNLSGGMNWVEEFLPNIGDEIIVIGTRRVFEAGKPSPAVKFPQGALLIPIKNLDTISTKLQVAFNQTIAIINFQAGMMGQPLMTVATDYKGVRILQASYVGASKGEMDGKKSLPVRFNLSPACATIGEYFVLASHGDIIRELVDNQGKEGPAPKNVNAGIWIKPGEARALLAENREPLIAGAMVEDGIPRAEAAGRIDLLIDIARYVRKFEFTSRESRATMGVRFEFGLSAPKE